MRKFTETLLLFLLLGLSVQLSAQQREKLPRSVKDKIVSEVFSSDKEYKDYKFVDGRTAVESSRCILKTASDGTPVYDIQVFAAAKSHYGVTMQWRTASPVKKGDVLLARITMRTLSARQESGESVVFFYFQEAKAPFDKSFITQIGAGKEWKTFHIPFVAHKDMQPGDASIGLAVGSLAQHVEVTGIEILNFEKSLQAEELPVTRFTYAGREKQAEWRDKALQRIEELRTASLNIQVVDEKGKPVKGAKVEVSLEQSHFIWGTAVNEAMLAGEDTLSKTYKEHVEELFNTAVIENGFKAGGWAWSAERKMNTLRAFDWLCEKGFRQRGHNLVWPAWKFNPPATKHIAMSDSAAFDRYIKAQFYERMAYTKGRVIAWDVVNELMHEKEFFRYLPYSRVVDWFKLAHELDPDAQLFINEYGMLNCVQSPQNIREYLDTIQCLREKGAPIMGIGIQGHVGRQPRNPEQVLTDLDLILPTGLPVQITEFDMNTPDEELQADYTRDFLIAVYSHPVVTGMTLWGFWEGAHWKPDASMFRKDWTPKANAAVWREWVTGKWKTHVESTTDKKGMLNVRGHLGHYHIRIVYGNKYKETDYRLVKGENTVVITL